MKNEFTSQSLAEAFAEHRARLLSLVEKRLNPIPNKRLSHEDVRQEVYLAAAKKSGVKMGKKKCVAVNAESGFYEQVRDVL